MMGQGLLVDGIAQIMGKDDAPRFCDAVAGQGFRGGNGQPGLWAAGIQAGCKAMVMVQKGFEHLLGHGAMPWQIGGKLIGRLL